MSENVTILYDKYTKIGGKVPLENCPVGPFEYQHYLYHKTGEAAYKTHRVIFDQSGQSGYMLGSNVVQPLVLKEKAHAEELKKIREVLDKEFGIDADIDEVFGRVEGSSPYVIALVVAPHEGTKNRWMLRTAPTAGFDRWANSGSLELFFDDADNLIGFLKEEKAYIYEDLFKCVCEEYDELLDSMKEE